MDLSRFKGSGWFTTYPLPAHIPYLDSGDSKHRLLWPAVTYMTALMYGCVNHASSNSFLKKNSLKKENPVVIFKHQEFFNLITKVKRSRKKISLIRAHISYQKIKMRICKHISNQNLCDVTTMFRTLI